MLGMFGRDGLSLIARSPFSGNEKEQLATSYQEFLERALHRGAHSAGRNSCSVKLKFIDDDDAPLEIQRIWHFNDSGACLLNDEEVFIHEGSTRRAVGPDAGYSRADWFRDYIAKNLLPFTLAHFFMFDGENVSALAEQEMAAQVRTGIEGLLGIPVLKKLADDLRDYARDRQRDAPRGADKTIENLERELEALTRDYEEKSDRLKEIEPDLVRYKGERERLTRQLASFGAGSQALLQEQYEQKEDLNQQVRENHRKMEDLLLKSFAMALSGPALRTRCRERLESEGVRDRWENGKAQGDSNMDRFLDAVEAGIGSIAPTLTENQRESVLDTARRAWELLWSPPPEGCAESYLHPYLNEPEPAGLSTICKTWIRWPRPTS